ncbi:FMN-dependent NADH-azoreductase [Acinetobacter sp. RF15A]|uniref:FMN-dependent NADH-azoreductase n=1 Tax=unclassified Acinetobacter TaxID=196816 RepID=UPI001195AB67|nr:MULTISPECIES: FMN-dependent NADH-azoreductase [unclassified Acinetobacter]TSH75842.1 FMN-dependent NADH-azoreductase [Acinetobacter sp. RF15A]TSI17481.1 FMN-dependent NADH-azoreductase [Acinetobacter sp. RF15B]
MQVLHIDSSILGDASISRQLSQAIVSQLQQKHKDTLQVEYLDLATQPIPHLTAEILMGQDAEQAALGEAILQQYLRADIIVVGAAMYNFGLPSTLKAWIDRISVAGRSFKYTENGPIGLAGNKKVYIASSRGGVYGEQSPVDFQEAFLKTVFNFTGVSDIQVIRAEGVNMGDASKQQALETAHQMISAL